jgi:hypothetical protein
MVAIEPVRRRRIIAEKVMIAGSPPLASPPSVRKGYSVKGADLKE